MTGFRWRERAAALAAYALCTAIWVSATGVGSGEALAAKKAKAAAEPSSAQSKSDPNSKVDPKQALAAAARQAYDAALKSYANGKYQPAVEQFTAALGSGGLSATEMAKSLYTRGLAYKKLGKNGLAISDLTSALWLKNGLSDADRKAATAARSEAYKTAGLNDPGDAPQSSGVSVGAATADDNQSAGLSAAAIAQASGAAPKGQNADGAANGGVTRQAPDSPSAQDAARARATGYAPVNDGGIQGAVASSVVKSPAATAPAETASNGGSWSPFAGPAEASTTAPPPAASLAQREAPAPAPAASSSEASTSTVSGFFSNLFGGGSKATPAAAAQPAPAQTASNAPVAPEVSSWSSATTVTGPLQGKHASAPQPKVAMAAPPAAAKPAVPKGKYKMHIAAVRSRAEADAIAQKLVAEHRAELGDHTPTVDEATIGSMGKFFRVRVNGYASQDEPRGLCTKLRSSGLDCLVVTN